MNLSKVTMMYENLTMHQKILACLAKNVAQRFKSALILFLIIITTYDGRQSCTI